MNINLFIVAEIIATEINSANICNASASQIQPSQPTSQIEYVVRALSLSLQSFQLFGDARSLTSIQSDVAKPSSQLKHLKSVQCQRFVKKLEVAYLPWQVVMCSSYPCELNRLLEKSALDKATKKLMTDVII